MTLNFNEICRFCMQNGRNMLSLYYHDSNIAEKVMTFAPLLKICAEDGLPEQACPQCILQINNCYSFKLQCEKSDETLRQLQSEAQQRNSWPEIPQMKRRRRGTVRIEDQVKLARDRGEEFITPKGLLLVEKKTTGPDCECRKKCTSLFSHEQRQNIVKCVYSGRPKNERDAYLMRFIQRHDVARHRPRSNYIRPHKSSFKYFAMKDGKSVEVCRKAYLSLHAISDKATFRLTNLVVQNKMPVDMRGKHDNHCNMRRNVIRWPSNTTTYMRQEHETRVYNLNFNQ
ncbi:hypothetical protein C0J52_22107 [Blattella germanica]|nr:hypothetical protein C0J52_22107 [Blattella germanica]